MLHASDSELENKSYEKAKENKNENIGWRENAGGGRIKESMALSKSDFPSHWASIVSME